MSDIIEQFGKFKLLEKIASGGMGEIFLARHVDQPESRPPIALKRILEHRSSDSSFVRLFLREAKLISKLNHPNLVKVIDFGKELGTFYMTMEYVKGVNLTKLFKQAILKKSKWKIDIGIEIVRQALEGMEHAHSKRDKDDKPIGIVHLDLSPGNLMVTNEGQIKILDFGVSRAIYSDDQKAFNALRGTYAYMSPEQCKEKNVDKRSDLFTLGIILYELTTLSPLFSKQPSEFMTLKSITEGIIPPPTNIDKGYPEELENLIYKALEVDPSKRFHNSREFIKALDKIVEKYNLEKGKELLAKSVAEIVSKEKEKPEKPEKVEKKESKPQKKKKENGKKKGKKAKKAQKKIEAKDNKTKTEKKDSEEEKPKSEIKEDKPQQKKKSKTQTKEMQEVQAARISEIEEKKQEALEIKSAANFDYQEELVKRHKSIQKQLVAVYLVFFLALAGIVSGLGYQYYCKTGMLEETAGSKIYVPQDGKIFVETIPEGAKVYLNAKEQDKTTPTRITELSLSKDYEIEIHMDGYEIIRKKMQLNKEEPLDAVFVKMKKKK